MRHRIKLNRLSESIIKSGFEACKPSDEIAAEVTSAGQRISSRTVSRMRSDRNRQLQFKRIVREGALAVRACEGDVSAIEHLARSVDLNLDPRWQDKRKDSIMQTLRAFVSAPMPKLLVEVRQELTLYMFEHQFEKYVQSSKSLDEVMFL